MHFFSVQLSKRVWELLKKKKGWRTEVQGKCRYSARGFFPSVAKRISSYARTSPSPPPPPKKKGGLGAGGGGSIYNSPLCFGKNAENVSKKHKTKNKIHNKNTAAAARTTTTKTQKTKNKKTKQTTTKKKKGGGGGGGGEEKKKKKR